MVFIRHLIASAILILVFIRVNAQQIYYPANASQLLQSTAADVSMLLQKATAGTAFTTQAYSSIPSRGIIFTYDSTITDNQSCRVQSNGFGKITFSAAEDNGLNFGIYQYLQSLGFRFYQPGSIWEIIPSLTSPYKNIDTVYSCSFKYKNWFISGGHSRWIMDNSNDYPWDTYFGQNGHQWALYQRRNNMTGGNRFTGHRDDIMDEAYINTLQSNPCYVAPYNGSRIPTGQSVPDINNVAAMQLWQAGIQQKYAQFKNTIYGNRDIYANYFRNFSYNYGYIGLEVPDGAHWANSKDNTGCSNVDYLKESDQHFTLANFTAAKLNALYPDKHFQLYAYDGHADVPSSNISINPRIDIQVVATGFQSESSAKGLLSRWYKRSHNISEYHYLNLPQWSGETPSFFLDDLKNTVQRIKDHNGEGIVLEASPAKFASLPFLLAANAALKDNTPVDRTLQEFCDNLFGHAAPAIFKLLQMWSNDKTVTVTNGIQDNKYKLSLYLQLLNEAAANTANDPLLVRQRISELKAYLHYMVLYFDLAFDQRSNTLKSGKAAALCLYLARVNKLQIVNSYFLITDIVNRYAPTDAMYVKYNTSNGTAYLNGLLPLITAAEIEQNFMGDLSNCGNTIQQYTFEDAATIKTLFEENNLKPLDRIDVKISYTSGKDYPGRSEFYFTANQAGSIAVKYTPHFDMPGKGNINFTVESTDKALEVIKDFSITNNDGAGTLNVSIPSAGTYMLTVISKYKSAVDLQITTNGNYFYKNGPFLGNTTENYRGDLLSLPGYFHVPAAVNKIYFSLNNSNPGGAGFASPQEINAAFQFKDNNNNTAAARLVSNNDSALFYMDVPAGSSNSFWKAGKMEQYRLSFANISNIQWYASKKQCSAINFTAAVIKQNGECSIELKTTASPQNLMWKVTNAERTVYFTNQQTVNLPVSTAPNTLISLTINNDCIITKRLADIPSYLQQLANCSGSAAIPSVSVSPVIYPNPSHGIYNCQQNGSAITAEKILIHNAEGALVAGFTAASQFNISHLPGGVYFYTLIIKSIPHRGKLLKL